MDFPYDHIQEEILAANDPSKKGAQDESSNNQQPNVDLNTELQETFRAFSASPWGARIGGLWDNVRKQGETYYEGAREEYAAVSEEAVKGFSDLRETIVGRTRGLSLSTGLASSSEDTEKEKEKDEAPTPTAPKAGGSEGKDAEGESFFARIKTEAAKRFRELEKAEEAADEAILRFGMNIRQKLQDAVSIVPPESDSSQVLFESKDADGKRVIHATRFEAQLHVIHSNLENFTKDPDSDQWPKFNEAFNAEAKTGEIASNLEKYPELRSAMEKLVPEQVEYSQFWSRYYFLRFVIETEEQKRKELLKDANVNEEEEVGWDDDSEPESDESDESESPSTPQVKGNKANAATPTQGTPNPAADKKTLKPIEPRRSNDQQSQADSESSYDVVSGTTSRTPGSPKEKSPAADAKGDDSDDDWE
ncbi:BSD domain-containing protein [Aspergillus ruber CBS 135680]|uniref:BSD domain-containing protein n=1 Tax=Aspergillus ruber (strain CBS 135680) TaxID=1388766 RepID=A0A017S1V8_ASPRC|nr:uncharacterized protein EURHEDRAFT_466029 [Aspergillus ruber CBS 135680]EYE90937.1 hypothetical protein EURHEDRAFT_466029 [Aspergillus ruber CBS 135680]